MYKIVRFFVFILCIDAILCHTKHRLNTTYWNQIDSGQKVIESWTKLGRQNLNLDLLTSGLASKLNTFLQNTSNITSKCGQSLLRLKADAQIMKTYAIRALESWGRFPAPSFFSGTFSSLGDYDSCLMDDALQYCTVHLRPVLPMRRPFENINNRIAILTQFMDKKDQTISVLAENAQLLYYTAARIGVCLPIECTSNEINNILQTVVKSIEMKGTLINCESNEIYKEAFDFNAILTLSGFGLLILFSIIGTTFDCWTSGKQSSKKNEIWANLARSFSLNRNFNNLIKSDSKIREFECLNGLRFFSMIWIIFNHSFLWMNHYTFANCFKIYKFLNGFGLSGIFNGFFAVDTFFLISGILITYMTFKRTGGSFEKFNLFLYAISRYLRLTPGVIFSTATFFLLPYLGSGPFFTETVTVETENCRSHWFINLIYLQTNIPGEDSFSICNLPVWWLSIEMKLHFLSTIIVICLFFKPKLSFLIAVISIICSTIWAIIDHLIHNYPPFTISTIPEIEEFAEFSSDFLHRTHIHIGPFFIGLFMGFFLATDKRGNMNLSRRQKAIGWSVAIITMFALLFGPYPWVLGVPYSRWEAAIYASLCQTVWCLSLSWIIFACANGFGGFVNTFLTFKLFRPLARTIYMTYLTHGIILVMFAGTRNKLIPLETSNLAYMVIGNIFLSFLYGFIATLFVESPTLNLIKLLIKRIDQPACSDDRNNNIDSKNNKSKISLKLEEI